MLKALDHLSVRPLEAINLIRNLLKVDAFLIPMSEQPVDLMAIDHEGHEVYGEVNIDQLASVPRELMLSPPVPTTREAIEAIAEADLILIGPGSFYTSLTLADRVAIMEQQIGKRVIDALVVGPKADIAGIKDRVVIQTPLDASDVPYRHDRQLLRRALDKAIQALG